MNPTTKIIPRALRYEWGWVAKICLFVFWGSHLMGEKKHINKIPLKSWHNPGQKILFTPPLQKLLTQTKTRNYFSLRIIPQALCKFRIVQTWMSLSCLHPPITQINSWGINFLVIARFCYSHPQKLHKNILVMCHKLWAFSAKKPLGVQKMKPDANLGPLNRALMHPAFAQRKKGLQKHTTLR